MGIRFNPGLQAMGIQPEAIEKLIDVQKIPVQTAEKRRDQVIEERAAFEQLTGLISQLDTTLNRLKTRYDFTDFKLDSSHPDILDGSVTAGALLGTYELEVRALAKAEKELAYGFPDKNDTPVGFGFLYIERHDAEPLEIAVEPDTTLDELASQINHENAGVKAMVINTGYQPDPYRLLVVSESSGEEAKLTIDSDTTFLEFKEQVTGRNLDILFEDVPVTSSDNVLDELIAGVTLQARRSEPGTRVQITVLHDVDATFAKVQEFVEQYNKIANFVGDQFQKSPETGEYGLLSGDSSVKYVMRSLQNALFVPGTKGGSLSTLAEIGITTEPRRGTLNLDTAKLEQALRSNYDAVAALFVRSDERPGVADQLAQAIRQFRAPAGGALSSRKRALDKIVDSYDKDITRRKSRLEDKEASIRRQFTALESTLASLQGQSDFLKAKMGGNNKSDG